MQASMIRSPLCPLTLLSSRRLLLSKKRRRNFDVMTTLPLMADVKKAKGRG